MGRIPTFVIIIVGVVLIVGVSALMMFMMLKPQQEALTAAQGKLTEEKRVADGLPDAEAALADVKADWDIKQAELAAMTRERSIPVSFAHPAAAMVALWYEYIEDLAPLVERWVESTGCVIESGASFPAPAMTPPAPPSNGIMQIPDGGTVTLTVSGNIASLERLYRSLDQFERIVTINQLVITAGEGETLRAQVPFKLYLLVEVPASMVAAAPAAGPGGGPGMGMEGMPGPEGMGGPEGMPPGGDPTAGDPTAGDPGGDDEAGGDDEE